MRALHARVARNFVVALILTVVGSSAVTASASASSPTFNSLSATPEQRGESFKLVVHEGLEVTCQYMTPHTYSLLGLSGSVLWTGAGFILNTCTTNILGTCTSPGLSSGSIQAKEGKEEEEHLFYLSKVNHEAGVVLNSSETGEQTTWMTFTCVNTLSGTHKFTVRGSALAKVEPVNTFTWEYTLTLAASKWVPALTEYENFNGEKKVVSLEAQEVVQGTVKPWKSAALSAKSLLWRTEPTKTMIQG